jgi:hypothetical protein
MTIVMKIDICRIYCQRGQEDISEIRLTPSPSSLRSTFSLTGNMSTLRDEENPRRKNRGTFGNSATFGLHLRKKTYAGIATIESMV